MQRAQEGTALFSQIDFINGEIYVKHEGNNYKWLQLDSLEIKNIINQFKDNFNEKWKKRFSEDMVEYLNKLDLSPNHIVQVTLQDDGGVNKSINVTFDRDKRTEAKKHYEATYFKEMDIHRLLSQKDAIADLNQLQDLIEKKYSYYFLNNVDVSSDIQQIKTNLPDTISTYDLALLVGKFLNKFGDGHTRLQNVSFRENGTLDFKTHHFKDKVICSKDGKLLQEGFPFLHSINGISTAQLLSISEEYLTQDASPQFKKMVKASRLNRIGQILKIAGSTEKKLHLELASNSGETTSLTQDMVEFISLKDMSLAEQMKMQRDNEVINPFEVKQYENIGYLKIKSMAPLGEEDSFELPLEELQNSEAIILDVRNNGGGRRDILIELAPHFISPTQGFIIGNIARLRTNQIDINHDLTDRYLYQLKDESLSQEVKQNITSWSRNFLQKIELTDSLYSPYYYLHIKSHLNSRFINKPTVVLMNEGCFSATDIFLSSFKEIDGVTLIGTASGGGSGRTNRYALENSLLEIKLSTIVSFQPNGDLYDGIGVQPDIEIINNVNSNYMGTADHQLVFALNFLKEQLTK